MKKKFVRLISAVLSAAMTLTAVPLSAFAEGEGHTHDGESNVITTPLDFREKTADESGDGWNWVYDTKTLTLNGVNIQAIAGDMSVVTVPDGTEIVLNGENTIVQTDTLESDTYVLSAVNNKEVNCDGTMTISGDGVLNAENRSTDSMARSLGGSIILNGGTVNATGTVKTNLLEIHNDGVLNANATTASFEGVAVNVSGGITVDGNGSLTAVGCANESTLNSAILLTSNFGDKISVSENGSITVPEGNAAKVGIYYDGNKSIDAEISGGKVTAYGTKCGIYKVNLIMSGTGSVYATGGTYGIGQTVPTIDENEFVIKGSTEFKASESAVTGEVKYNSGYYEIGGADAKTVVIKPDTSPRIILGNQIGIFKTEEYEIMEDMPDTKLKGTVYFDITLKNMSDEEFADARGYFGDDELDLSASIIKTDYGWVCMVCDTKFSTTYDTDNTLTIKCGDIVSNTVQVKSNANRFNKVTQGDNTNRTVFYTNTSQEEKDNYKLVSTYTVDSESISYNWYSTNSAYSADELGAAVSGTDGEFKLADNIPAGNYVLYCDITYSDGDSTETVTEKFTFTYKECAHENGYSDGKCTDCGALCDHSDINTDTGKCSICGKVCGAIVIKADGTAVGYDDLAAAFAEAGNNNGRTLKLFSDYDLSEDINVSGEFTIDLNKKYIHCLNSSKIIIGKNATISLTGNAGSNISKLRVTGGTLTVLADCSVLLDEITVQEGKLNLYSGRVESLHIEAGADIALYGGYISGVFNDTDDTENPILLRSLLADGYAFATEDDNGIITVTDVYDSTISVYESINLYVVEHKTCSYDKDNPTGKCEECGKPCEHGGDINTDTGICSICGAVVSVALYTDKNGSLKYVDTDELHSLLNESGKSGTVKLFKDYYKLEQHDIDGVITIDLNGHDFTVRGVTPWSGGKVTFKNSGSEQVTCSGSVSPTVDDPGGTLIVDGDIYFDSAININDYGTVILNAGKYVDLTIKGDRTLCDMLGEGKAFFDANGNLFNASVQAGSDLTVKDHSHTYVDGKCDCGYVCPHSDVDIDTGKCTECEYQYAAVIVKDGAVASVYKETEMGAAFEAADSDANTGCTLRVYKNYTGSYTTLSGKFTLWIAEEANVGTLTVSRDITVTGSGKNNSIYGDFNVANGGKLTFDENCGAMGTVSVGAGTFDCYYSIDITLNINDASSDVILHGGAFRKICYNGGGDRANAEILTLLAENRMFMWRSGGPIDGSKTLLKDGFATTVFVIPHEGHSYDSTTGKCKLCGKRCGHTDVDSKTGVCSVCEYQLIAGVSGVGTAKYFDNIDDAFTAALSEENSGCTLTLYKHCEITQNVEIGNTTVTVDVNGCSLGGEADISVNNGGVLYLKDSRKSTYYGCIDAPFSVNGGTLINGTADGGSSAADVLNLVINSAKCVEIYGGIFENVYIAHASGVALYGGRYNTICGEESNTPVNALLAKGYAFATVQEFTTLPESIVDGSAKTIGGRLTNVMVVEHEHRYNVETGKCPCGVCALAIFTETTQSSETYTFIESETQFKNIAENEADGVLKLTGDVDCIVKGIIINGNKTIDMNGHTLNVSVGTEEISAVAVYGNVTFENSGSSRAVINATGVYSYGMVTVNGDIEFDTFAIFEDGDALINAGVFKSIYVQGRSVIEILGSGKALASESGEILNASVQQIYRAGDNMFVTAHPKHTYDDHGNCACGYKCLHDGEGQVNEDSANKVCSECGAKIYAKVTTADGKVKYFDDITEGLRYADKAENKGCVFTLVTSGEIKSEVTLSSGQFTIAANNYGTIGNYYGGRITIDGADVVAKGHLLIKCEIYVNSGSLTLPEDSSTRFGQIYILGGTVNISEGVNADNNAGADNLIIANNATDAKLTIGGGTYGRIVLGQHKFKDVLASGARVISYDNPSDPTAEKTATALLYSDIAEESSLAYSDGRYYLVTKCEHKNEDGSYAFNEGGICKYCNSEFAASVSYTVDGSAKTDLFTDIYDAFDKANEIGTATITLYKDITDKCTQGITVTGNVTLNPNGKTLRGRYGIALIDGGTLTVNGDGDMDTSIYVNENSKLVFNGGGLAYVRVNKEGNAEIKGGTFSDFRIEDGGNAVIKGGRFYSLKVSGEGRNVGQLLAEGYAYKSLDGFWSTVAEREKQGIARVDVREAPIKSASISWAGGEAPVIYRNGDKYLNVNVTYTLADGSSGVTYSDYVNGNNRSKDSKLYTNIMAHCQEIGKYAAKDGEVEYYTVLKCDGYEYKSNVLKFTLATCSHPEDSFNYENNGWVICGICAASIEAEVVDADGKSLGYADIYGAIKLAQENEGSTVKLMSERVSASITVTGGKFTVDFNGKEASYQFAVSGGDVTFTSSAVQDVSNQNLQSGITVNGTDAKVTIDGKIKLGRVRIISGALKINSTQGYIKELSIIGGNAVIDNAIIGALQTNGGDTVINCVEADSLSVNINGSGSISIVSGRFGSFTCNADSGYNIGKVMASGSRVIGLNSMVGSGFKYAEIQSMTQANYLNVIKCDHKDGSGSYVLDGNPCPYCNEEIAATVSYTTANGGEMTDLFSDIYDAFAKANEIGTATVTLYKDITNSELTQGVTITGNVTLALNGKKLGGTFAFNAPVEVSDGGMFTVGGDGKMRMPIKAYANSKLIINGGEFTSVMVYIDGDAEIGDGVIDALTIIGNAKAKISGGKFYNIEIANGSLESVLADGYAYKKDGGAWLSIAERAESVYSSVNNDNKPVNVEEAPIKSATLSTEINKLYRNSNANPTLKFNLALAHGSNLNDSYVSKRYGINSYVSGDIIYSSLSALVKDAKLSADEIIDKAGDSDVAEIYYVVTTGDGYEIKSNTVSIDLVDCDHSQVVDPTADKETAGNITTPTYCEICESKFNAKITKGDDVKYYNDLDEAAKDAQKSENEGCTLYPLYNKNGYGGQLVITEGNFTLKYAVRTAFSRPIIINGKAKLTVTGRCAVTASENQDAFIVRGGDVTFDGLATGSNVTINGGNVTMAANNINCLTINGGNVSISSGGFAEIVTTVSDKVIADYIDPGFWVQDRGTKEWIDIYSLNKATASSTNGLTVRVCPMQIIKPIDTVYYTNGYYPDGIPSLQINAEPWYSNEVDAKVAYQWIAIDENGYETVIEGATGETLSLENLTTGRYYCRLTYSNAATAGVSMKSDVVTATITECEHSGGKATCTEKAKCEICGAEYGEPLGHDYVVIKVVEPDYSNKGYSVFECTRCKDSYIGNRVPVKPIPDVEEIAVEKTTYNEVDISWKNISGVDGYNVECYVGDQWKQINCSADGDRVAAKLSGLSAGLKYKVRIAAYAGSFTGKFRCFYVDTVPSPVWNINTVKATDETVRISWNRNTRADGYKVEWYIDNQWSVKTVTGNNNIAAVIDGLCAGTRYKVRVSAYKGDLYSPYTYGYIDTLPSKVTGITQTVTSSSFTLTWDKNESADGYTVQYYADGKWNEKSLVGNDKTAVTIGSLKGYKTYKVRIKAYKGELQSTFDDIYITTAPTKVSGLKVKSAVDSKAVVIWNADATADGYNVGYYIGGKWVEKTITDNKTAMAELDGLTPYSTYKVRVRAYKDNLYGDYSYTTVTAVLSPVTGITVVSAKSNSITVKWDKNDSADGYKAEIYKGGKWVEKTLKGSANATVTIDGLRAGSVYKVRIASYKGANTSAYTYANVNTAK